MKFLYLDDSGSTKDINQEYVVLGGICISDISVRWLSYELEKLAQEIDPHCPGSVEFHAVEIISGRKPPWTNYPELKDRVNILKKVLHTLDEAYDSISTFAIAIEKKIHKNSDPMLKAYEDISQRFNNHLEIDCNPPEKGIIIIDNTSYETGLQNLAAEIRSTGNRIGQFNKSIIEIPLFVDSKVSRLVQLADHIAYAVFRRYNANDLTYFNVIENRFLMKNGKMHSLIHKCNNFNNCTCPACITRRT